MSNKKGLHIRKYQPGDRERVRWLCCETGFLGEPIDPLFQDREVFADYLTNYYTDVEPESSFVLEKDGQVAGYLLGSRRPIRQQLHNLWNNLKIASSVLWRFRHYNSASRHFIRWVLLHCWHEVPAAPRRVPHFHINLLPEARDIASTRALIDAYLNYLSECGERQVFGQMVTYEDRRTTRVFERYGFRVLNRSEVSKYRQLVSDRIYITTVAKDLEPVPVRSQLYGGKDTAGV